MTTSDTEYRHIVLDDAGVPRIAGTTMKVVELVTAQQAYGWSPEELAFQFPYLTLGQVHSALAYYWDHQQEFDREIARDLALVDDLRRRTPEAPIVARLRAQRAALHSSVSVSPSCNCIQDRGAGHRDQRHVTLIDFWRGSLIGIWRDRRSAK